MACNGFSMFANHNKARLEAQRCRKFNGMAELIQTCTPLWRALPEDSKKKWKDIARDYKRTEEYSERKRAVRRAKPRLPASSTPTSGRGKNKPPEESGEDDCDSEDDPGVPMVRSNTGLEGNARFTIRLDSDRQRQMLYGGAEEGSESFDLHVTSPALEEKKLQDKERIYDFFAVECGGRLVDVKRCRFLFLSMQTYGRLDDGLCIPAELAILEWSLAQGILDEFHAIVGPWHIENETLRDRATFNAFQAHHIPLEASPVDDPSSHRKHILREMLGRCEPGIAANQGVKVGLYKDGLVETKEARQMCKGHDPLYDTDTEELDASDDMGSTGTDGRKKEKERIWPLLPGDTHGRRWVVCLQSEYAGIMDGIRYLKDRLGIVYDGFPITPERFIFFDTVVEALADFVHYPLPESFKNRRSALEDPNNDLFSTPWDDVEKIYCSFHRKEAVPPTRCCALAIGRKACLSGFHALKQGFSLPVADIP